MPSSDVNAATRLAEASRRHDKNGYCPARFEVLPYNHLYPYVYFTPIKKTFCMYLVRINYSRTHIHCCFLPVVLSSSSFETASLMAHG